MSRYRSTSVHLLGGCNASSDPSQGVCNPSGQVFDTKSHNSVHPGLYVCDASLIPCSLGINPCLSIATVAEHVSRNLVSDVLKYKSDKGMILVNNLGDAKPGSITSVKLDSHLKSMVVVKETMRGYVGGMPCTAYLKMQMNSRTRKELDRKSRLHGLSHPLLRGQVGGYVLFNAVETDKLHIVDGEVDLCEVDERTPYTQYMHYTLLLAASSGSRYILQGKKVLNPYLFGSFAWSQTMTMNVTFNKVCIDSSKEDMLNLKGKLSISMIELLKCLVSLEGNMKRRFVGVLLQNLFRTYISQVPRGNHRDFNPSEFHQKPYPESILHEIQTVINKIRKLHGPLIKIHVVAHCAGGLAIHIALMGGHVSATHIASLSCTNSSMFFKLTTSSKVKMWLPLIPMSMVILGKNKILPMFKTSKASSRQRLLKSIARLVPRYERCTCDECEVLSGIFGNPFWHDNISPSMHYWLNKQNLPRLPMAGFPHLRKICNAGFIVDSNGNNSYLIHPERMALPTLYISGGRTFLVTPQTTFLASNYMKLHHPDFRHERVVVDGFGHSDLLIGEESYKKVFPHIISHIGLAEQGKNYALGNERRRHNTEALAWGGDPLEEGNRGFWGCISPLVTIWLLFLFLVMVVYIFH
ncbi:hypothetical protein HYC85_021734 [Camellia sinensis]|uniref:Cholesterol oxidase n=1 Tax=Camellia sinensis TaxID=4442 RepID=A0A7J7GJA0_CAMSI|nr:hypothetical protein HYC85_021734 [Camellia sinensis]